MSKEPEKNEEYAGPGKVSGALGTSATYGMLGGLCGGAGVAALTAMLVDGTEEKVAHLTEMMERKDIPLKGKTLVVCAAALAAANLSGFIGGLVGLVKGWRNAAKGKEQFDAMKAERDEAVRRASLVEQKVAALSAEVKASSSTFIDKVQTERDANQKHAQIRFDSYVDRVDNGQQAGVGRAA